jgi:hypothetical protein
LLIPICIGALCEKPSSIARVYRPFVQRSFFGRLAGRLLYPGWPSGVFYTVAVLILLAWPAYTLDRAVDPTWFSWTAISFGGALLFPAAVSRALFPRIRRPLIVFLLVQVLCAMIALLGAGLHGFGAVDLRPALCALPTTALLFIQTNVFAGHDITSHFISTGVVTLASLAFLLGKMRDPWREIRALEKIASALPPAPSLDASRSPAAN